MIHTCTCTLQFALPNSTPYLTHPLIPSYNLVTRLLRLFGQRLVTRRDSGVTGIFSLQDFCGETMQVKDRAIVGQLMKKFVCFSFPQSLSWRPPHWPKSLRTLGTRLTIQPCSISQSTKFGKISTQTFTLIIHALLSY